MQFLRRATAVPSNGGPPVDGPHRRLPRNALSLLVTLVVLASASLLCAANASATIIKTTDTSVVSSPSTSRYGDSVKFTATVTHPTSTDDAPVSAGTVQFQVAGSNIGGPLTPNTQGKAEVSTSQLGVGAHDVTATFTPTDATHYSGSEGSVTQQVKGTATVTIQPSANPSAFGDPVTFTIKVSGPSNGSPGGDSVTPTGSVGFAIDSNPFKPLTLTSGQAAYTTSPSELSRGWHAISANYNHDANYDGVTFVQIIQTVKTTSSLTISSSSSPSTYGQASPPVITFKVEGTDNRPPTGVVHLFTTDGSVASQDATLTACTGCTSNQATATFTPTRFQLGAGSHSFGATWDGDSYHEGSTGGFTQTVNKAPVNISVGADPNPSVFGQSVKFSATVADPNGGVVHGHVAFDDGAGTAYGTAAIDPASGIATLTRSDLSVGPQYIYANYNGDDPNYLSGLTSAPLRVDQAPTTTSLASSVNPSTPGQSVTFTASVPAAATGTVQFAIDGANAGAPVAISGGGASLTTNGLGVGGHSVSATYGGDRNYLSSTSDGLTQTVKPAPAPGPSPGPAPGAGTPPPGNTGVGNGSFVPAPNPTTTRPGGTTPRNGCATTSRKSKAKNKNKKHKAKSCAKKQTKKKKGKKGRKGKH